MSPPQPRRTQMTIAHLMAVVAAFALAFAFPWPISLPAASFVIVCYFLNRLGYSRLVDALVAVVIVAVLIMLLIPAVPTNCRFRPPAPAAVATSTTPAPAPPVATTPELANGDPVGPVR
jgi:amino acid transporter